MEDQDDRGLGKVGWVVPPLTLLLPHVRHRSVQSDPVRDQLVEAVHVLKPLLFRLISRLKKMKLNVK